MTQQSRPKFCAQCGESIIESARFCSECGNPIISVPTQSRPFQPTYPTEENIQLEHDIQQEIYHAEREANVAAIWSTIGTIVFFVVAVWFVIDCMAAEAELERELEQWETQMDAEWQQIERDLQQLERELNSWNY